MGHYYKRLLHLVAQAEEQAVQFGLVLAVKAARRLVGKYHRRPVDQCARHSHALPLAARQLRRLVLDAVGKPHILQQLQCPLACLALPAAAYQCRYHYILDGRELGQQLVELEHEPYVAVTEVGKVAFAQPQHVLPVIFHNAATVGCVERAKYLQQRGFPRPAASHYGYNLLAANGERHVAQHVQLPVVLVYAFCFNHLLLNFLITCAASIQPNMHGR